ALLDLSALLDRARLVAAQVHVPMVGHLVTGVDDRPDGVRVQLRRVARDEERGPDVVAAQYVEDPGRTADRAVASLGERREAPPLRGADPEPAGRGVEVERPRHRDLGTAGPLVLHR